jgi:heat shock protein HtpX
MGGVGFGLGLLYVLFGYYLIQVAGLGYVGLFIVLGIAWGQWFFCDTLALKAMRAVEVSPQQAPELHAMIDRLCALAEMPKPRVAVADTPIPNAFATGRSPNHSSVCVTTGILGLLTAGELEAVLSHELSHVAHRDVTVMTIASSAGLLAGFVTRWGFFLGGGRRNGNGGGGGVPYVVVFAVSMVVYVVSFLLTRLLSRYRELSADRAGAYLIGRPRDLASALTKISRGVDSAPSAQLRDAGGAQAFWFSRGDVSALFSTHPSLADRLAQLQEIERDLLAHPGG